jgi:two-component system response regulator VanR
MANVKNPSGQPDIAPKPAKPFSVLLVDDEDHIVAFIRIKLRLNGYSVLSAGNAFEALEILKSQPVDIAVIDLLMPGIGGLELIEQMRMFTRIPIIVLTSMDCPETKLQALSIGANDYLTKPFNPDEIVARVEQFKRIHTKPECNT